MAGVDLQLWRIPLFLAGMLLVLTTLRSAVRTFVLPRGAPDRLTRTHFQVIRVFFRLLTRRAQTYAQRDAAMALFAPTALVTLPVALLTLVMLGYLSMLYALGVEPITHALRGSCSSLSTLGFD